jgi:RNA polymerase sigma-B factor
MTAFQTCWTALGYGHGVDETEKGAHMNLETTALDREEMISSHLPLARKLAARYARTQEPFDDLYQVACVGLITAVNRFDPSRGVAFGAFAVPTILGELKRHFRNKGWSVHLPRGLQETVLKVQEAEAKLSVRDGRPPSVSEIADYLGYEIESVLEALDALAARRAVSLDAPIATTPDESMASLHDVVGSEEEGYAFVDTRLSLATAAHELPGRDRQVLSMYFEHKLAQRDVAAELGISQMQVSRSLRRSRNQLGDAIGYEFTPARRAPRVSRS